LYRLTKTPRGPICLASRRFRSRGRGIRCRWGCRNGLRIILHGGRYPSHESIIYWVYVPFNKNPTWSDIHRVTAIPLAWTGYPLSMGLSEWIAKYPTWTSMQPAAIDRDDYRLRPWRRFTSTSRGATSKSINSLPRAFRIGDGRGGDKGAYALGLRACAGLGVPALRRLTRRRCKSHGGLRAYARQASSTFCERAQRL
jgi:hypothetical protein